MCNNYLKGSILTNTLVQQFFDVDLGKFKSFKNNESAKVLKKLVSDLLGCPVTIICKYESVDTANIFFQHTRRCDKVFKLSFLWIMFKDSARAQCRIFDNSLDCNWYV